MQLIPWQHWQRRQRTQPKPILEAVLLTPPAPALPPEPPPPLDDVLPLFQQQRQLRDQTIATHTRLRELSMNLGATFYLQSQTPGYDAWLASHQFSPATAHSYVKFVTRADAKRPLLTVSHGLVSLPLSNQQTVVYSQAMDHFNAHPEIQFSLSETVADAVTNISAGSLRDQIELLWKTPSKEFTPLVLEKVRDVSFPATPPIVYPWRHQPRALSVLEAQLALYEVVRLRATITTNARAQAALRPKMGKILAAHQHALASPGCQSEFGLFLRTHKIARSSAYYYIKEYKAASSNCPKIQPSAKPSQSPNCPKSQAPHLPDSLAAELSGIVLSIQLEPRHASIVHHGLASMVTLPPPDVASEFLKLLTARLPSHARDAITEIWNRPANSFLRPAGSVKTKADGPGTHPRRPPVQLAGSYRPDLQARWDRERIERILHG